MWRPPLNVLSLIAGSTLFIVALVAAPLFRVVFDPDVQNRDWRTASAVSVGWAPRPDSYSPAIVQAYAAPAFGWRGAFADHCWIAVKAAEATHYQRFEVIGWRLRGGTSSIAQTETTTPDKEWYGGRPKLLQDIRGLEAEKIIAALPAAVASYPHGGSYRAWPGPNSNTFIAHIAREIPELKLALPGNALGKDYLTTDWLFARAPSGTGFQFSLGGLFGMLVALREGVEINVLGLVVGIDPLHMSVTVPGFGRVPARTNWTSVQS